MTNCRINSILLGLSSGILNLFIHWRYGDLYEVEVSGDDRRAGGRKAFQERHEDNCLGSPFRDSAARRRIQTTIEPQSSKARSKTEAETRFPRPCRRRLEWRRRALALAGQSLVGKALTYDLGYRQLEATTVVHSFPIVVAESLLVDIAEQVERLHADVGAVQAAFEQAPEILDCIGVDIAVYVFDGMIDDCVIIVLGQSFIRTQFITENRGTGFDVLADRFLKFLPATFINVHRADFPVAFDHTKDDCFVSPAGAVNFLCSFVLVHVARLAADEGLIDFHLAAQLAAVTLHREADAMEHEPCGLLSDANRPVKLPRANPILIVYDQPDRRKPFVQSERRVLEYCSGLQAELRTIVLAVAFPYARFVEIDDMAGIAARTAHNTVWPAKLNHEFAAIVVVFEVDNRFSECVSKFHKQDISNLRLVCQVYSCPN
jgi:hypothetical protein